MQNTAAKPVSDSLQKDATTPFLSILCITFNHEKYISKTLGSFLMQETNFPIEIVIGEDCSTDQTRSIIENYKNSFPEKIRVVTSNANVGVTENFRRTLKACKGKYIALCEGDDYWEDEAKLQTQVDFLEENSRYVITYHDARVIDDDGKEKGVQLPKKYQCDATSSELIYTRPISTLTACFRNVLTEIPSEFNHAPALDLCLWSLLGRHGEGKYMADIKPAVYRAHQGGIFSFQSESNRIRMTMQTYLCLARFYENRAEEKISQEFTIRTALIAGLQLGIRGRLSLIMAILRGILFDRMDLIRSQLSGK